MVNLSMCVVVVVVTVAGRPGRTPPARPAPWLATEREGEREGEGERERES